MGPLGGDARCGNIGLAAVRGWGGARTRQIDSLPRPQQARPRAEHTKLRKDFDRVLGALSPVLSKVGMATERMVRRVARCSSVVGRERVARERVGRERACCSATLAPPPPRPTSSSLRRDLPVMAILASIPIERDPRDHSPPTARRRSPFAGRRRPPRAAARAVRLTPPSKSPHPISSSSPVRAFSVDLAVRL